MIRWLVAWLVGWLVGWCFGMVGGVDATSRQRSFSVFFNSGDARRSSLEFGFGKKPRRRQGRPRQLVLMCCLSGICLSAFLSFSLSLCLSVFLFVFSFFLSFFFAKSCEKQPRVPAAASSFRPTFDRAPACLLYYISAIRSLSVTNNRLFLNQSSYATALRHLERVEMRGG